MCVASLPYTVATFISPLPNLFMVGLQIPFYMFGIIVDICRPTMNRFGRGEMNVATV